MTGQGQSEAVSLSEPKGEQSAHLPAVKRRLHGRYELGMYDRTG
jgi:hypothetical protein